MPQPVDQDFIIVHADSDYLPLNASVVVSASHAYFALERG